jgi:hypothetical protein
MVDVPQRSFLAYFTPTDEDTRRVEVTEDLMKELSRMRREVFLEYEWFKSEAEGEGEGEGDQNFQRAKARRNRRRKRMMYLFLKDLSDGVCGDVMTSKVQRDSMSMSMKFNRVPWFWKFMCWGFVLLMLSGMLFYVFLFAMKQTHSRQSAWFRSFLMWVIFEIFVSSTGMVVLFHLLIPLYVLTDVVKLKVKVLTTVLSFRDQYSAAAAADPMTTTVGAGAGDLESNQNGTDFNSAKFLFTSWRVASLLRRNLEEESPESRLVLRYQTLWPSKRFGTRDGEVSGEYDQAVILGALSRILMYFLCSLLRFHTLFQDILFQMLWTSGLGYFGVCLIGLSKVNPLLPVIPLLFFALGIYFVLSSASKRCELSMRITADSDSLPFAPSPLPSPVGHHLSVPLNNQPTLTLESAAPCQQDHTVPREVPVDESSSGEDSSDLSSGRGNRSINYSVSSEEGSADYSSQEESGGEEDEDNSKQSSSEDKSETDQVILRMVSRREG